MSQYDFGDLESPLSGTTFFNTHLEPWRDALHSMHIGSSRPSYAVEGMMWIDNTTTPWILKIFNGSSNDVSLGTIDKTNLWFQPSGISQWGGSAGGTANALTLTPTIPWTSYETGKAIECLITADSTSSTVTVNISSLGTKNVKALIGAGKVNVPKGALRNGMVARFVYDGTDLILLNVRHNNKGADIATASTVNLNNATGDYVLLTGTTTVTAITLAEGLERTCVAGAAFTLTNGASLILPSGANISVAAGDVFIVRGEASGVVRVVNYMKADGTPVVGGGGADFGTMTNPGPYAISTTYQWTGGPGFLICILTNAQTLSIQTRYRGKLGASSPPGQIVDSAYFYGHPSNNFSSGESIAIVIPVTTNDYWEIDKKDNGAAATESTTWVFRPFA